MGDMAAAAAAALRDRGEYVLVTGRPTPSLNPLLAAASRHVVAPGPATRLAVAAGVELGGRRAVTVVDTGCAFDHASGVALTESAAAALAALRHGWSVVQPWRSAELSALLALAPRPTVVALAAAADPPLPPGVPRVQGLRLWQEGELATLVASGAAVTAMLRIGRRLQDRGVGVTVAEVAVLTGPAHAPLVGGEALHVGGPGIASLLADGQWQQPLERVELGEAQDADLIGLVLSSIRTR